MCTFPERPCTQAFGAHLLAHPDTEHWSTCPICSNKEGSGITSREKAAEKFDHPLHFFKHVEEMHMRIQVEQCYENVIKILDFYSPTASDVHFVIILYPSIHRPIKRRL
jgi:hypothetical protein